MGMQEEFILVCRGEFSMRHVALRRHWYQSPIQTPLAPQYSRTVQRMIANIDKATGSVLGRSVRPKDPSSV